MHMIVGSEIPVTICKKNNLEIENREIYNFRFFNGVIVTGSDRKWFHV